MSLRVQFKRGTSRQIENCVLDDGEIVINTNTKSIHVGDGTTLGGHEIPSKVEIEKIVKNSVSISKSAEDLENGTYTVSQSSNVITENPDVSILALQQDIWGYKADRNYAVGSYVMYQGDIYKCIQAVSASSTHLPTDESYWDVLICKSFIDGRLPVGASIKTACLELPDNALWENGAEYDIGDVPKLYAKAGFLWGSSTAVKAECSLGVAHVAGANGNNIRITVASSSGSFLVTTYYGENVVDSQLVANISALKNSFYVEWDRSATLTNDANVTMNGGVNGTSIKVPDSRGRYDRTADDIYPLGYYIAEQLPNIRGFAKFGQDHMSAECTGAFVSQATITFYAGAVHSSSGATTNPLEFDASLSNNIYTDSSKVLPLSISKQSYIIYR